MKKEIAIKSLIAFAVISILVITIVFGSNPAKKDEFNVSGEILEEVEERKYLIDERISQSHSGTAEAGLDKYSMMLTALDATIENAVEYNNILYNYEYLKRAYKLDSDSLDYIADLIIKGYEPMTVMDICYFWLDTNESIDIVEKIYSLKDRYRTSTWIENAFNIITKDKCGVLDEEDVDEYMNKGVTLEEIATANKLSRKGVMTIQEILDRKIAGSSLAEISAEINGESLSDVKLNSAANEINQGTVTYDLFDNLKEVSCNEVLNAEELKRIGTDDFGSYIQQSINGTSLQEKLEEIEDDYSEEIMKDMHAKGLYRYVSPEARTEYNEALKKEAGIDE